MNFELLLESAGNRRVRAALTGAGDFGSSFLFQALRMSRLDVPVVINRTPSRAVNAYVAAGVSPEDVVVCESAQAALGAFESGKRVVVADSDLVKDLPLDVLVEGTGHPETGALHAMRAVESGWHVVMVSKEVDSVVGPELSARAAANGRVYTPAEGDQPSLLIGLISWARVLGLKILSAGKSSEYDFVYDPVCQTSRRTRRPSRPQEWRISGIRLACTRWTCAGSGAGCCRLCPSAPYRTSARCRWWPMRPG